MNKVIFDRVDGNPVEIANTNDLYKMIIEDFDSFCQIGCGGGTFYFYVDDIITKELRINTDKNLGICLTHETYYNKYFNGNCINDRFTHLAVYDKTKLDEAFEIDDGLFTSTGLLLPPEIAWKGIVEFIKTGLMSLDLEWITSDVISEDGNWC